MPAPQRKPGPGPSADHAAARDALRKAILEGEYLPGEPIAEPALRERFGASWFTIRSALQDLAADGLVDVQRDRSVRVRKLSFEEAVEITEGRMVLEGLIAARAAERVTDEQVSELDEIGLLMRRAVTAGQLRRYSELNGNLHAMIQAVARHRTAERLIAMRGQLVRHQYALSLLPGRPAVSLPQHERIIAAIRARSPKAAEEAMRAHIASVIEALRSLDAIGLT